MSHIRQNGKPAVAQIRLLPAALHYASVGIPIFPLHPTKKKALIKGWQQLATTSERQIKAWFDEFPRMRIATVAGMRSGIVNFDLDTKEGKDGPGTLDMMARFLGDLPPALVVSTPSGGQHRYYRWPSGVSIYNRAGDIAPGVDVRGSRADGSKGGIIPLPPSPGGDDRAYLFNRKDVRPDELRSLPDLPRWLLYLLIFRRADRLRLHAIGINGPDGFAGATPDQWEAIGREKLREQLRVSVDGLPGGGKVLPADVHQRLVRYARKGIADECAIVVQVEKDRDIQINNSALKVWSLLKGLEDWIGETAELEEITAEARTVFLEAASKLGDDETDGPFVDIAAEKWERVEDDAEPRDLSHKAQERETPEDAFADILEKPVKDQQLVPLPEREQRVIIKATPYLWTEPAGIAPREWRYGRHMISKYATLTVAPGGLGKTSLVLVELLAIATGRDLLGYGEAPERGRVWWWNGEDPFDEQQRRIQAACLHYSISRSDIEGWFFTDSGRDMPIALATETKNGTTIWAPVSDQIKATLSENGIEALAIDPFVSSHRVKENDNNAIDAVVKEWGRIAGACSSAVELVHHARKTGGGEVTSEDARGGSALHDGTRATRTLNRMTKEEAEAAGIGDDRRFYFRVDDESRMAPPAGAADWYRLHSVDLGNATAKRPSDTVGVVAAWEWPDPLASLPTDALQKAVAATMKGEWRADVQAGAWIGKPIAEVLGLDLGTKRAREQVKALLKDGKERGLFVEYMGQDSKRNPRTFIKPLA